MSIYNKFIENFKECKSKRATQKSLTKLVHTLRHIDSTLPVDKTIKYPGLTTFIYHLNEFKIVLDRQPRGDLYAVFEKQTDGSYAKKPCVEYGDQERSISSLGVCEGGIWPDKGVADAIIACVEKTAIARKHNIQDIEP